MTTRTKPWSFGQVLGLASDPASARAAQGLAGGASWPVAGASPRAVWGLCQGSRPTPYQTVVELTRPAYRCSCPSQKVPCKHALGLLLLWSGGAVAQTDEPDWVSGWVTERVARAERSARRGGSDGDGRIVDPVAAERRATRRAERVAAGITELEGWLADQVRRGLAGLEPHGYAELSRLAARMVDAQAPGLAGAIRRAAGAVGSGPGWPGELLEELAMIHLTVAAYRRMSELPAALAETVQARIGWTVPTARVLAGGERVEDDWLVLGRVVEMDDRLTVRRLWLHGHRTGRRALLLSFTPAGQPPEPLPGLPGGTIEGALHFYPGAVPLRALLAPESSSEAEPGAEPAGSDGRHAGRETEGRGEIWRLGQTVAGTLFSYAELLALDPWLERWPMVLTGVRPARNGDRWALVDEEGDGLELRRGVDPWPLLTVSAGEPLTVAGEWSRFGFRPMTCWDADRPVVLS